jgi:hypothetical protein
MRTSEPRARLLSTQGARGPLAPHSSVPHDRRGLLFDPTQGAPISRPTRVSYWVNGEYVERVASNPRAPSLASAHGARSRLPRVCLPVGAGPFFCPCPSDSRSGASPLNCPPRVLCAQIGGFLGVVTLQPPRALHCPPARARGCIGPRILTLHRGGLLLPVNNLTNLCVNRATGECVECVPPAPARGLAST